MTRSVFPGNTGGEGRLSHMQTGA